jgi:hypothetical protein
MELTVTASLHPNFVEMVPTIDTINVSSKRQEIKYRLAQIGQPSNKHRSKSLFEEPGIPAPHVNSECLSDSEQAACCQAAFEKVLFDNPSDFVKRMLEETKVIKVPCISFPDSTERSETLAAGTNELIGCQSLITRPGN